MDKKIKEILEEEKFLKGVFENLIKLLPSFDITDKKVLPYGLKPHTRSVSWLVEQVVTQQAKYRAGDLGIEEVKIDLPDTCLHDCEIKTKGKIYFVNVKIHNTEQRENKNDIAAVEKLYMQYAANKNYDVFYACFGINFSGIRINFDSNYLTVFSPQFLPIYVNPRNDKIQSYYQHEKKLRTREKFLELLRKNSKSIVL